MRVLGWVVLILAVAGPSVWGEGVMRVKVSGVQMYVSPNLEENLPKILDHIEKSEADYLLFPEMSLTGYHGDFDQAEAEEAWKKIAEACRKSKVTAFIGTGCKQDGETFIQTRIYNGEGELVGSHEKMVPTNGDRLFCAPGKELRSFENQGLEFGALICNDFWVTPGCGPYPDPRLAFQLGEKGARVIFQAIHSGSSQLHTPYHESNLVLRAMESKVFVVTANAAEKKGPVNAATGLISPDGEWLVKVPREGEQIFVEEIEIPLPVPK